LLSSLAVISLFFKALSWVPLRFMQALGGILGWCIWWLSPGYRRNFRHQVSLSGVDPARAQSAVAAAGRMVAELPWVWARSRSRSVLSRFDWEGDTELEQALSIGKGVIIMSPHLGSWEIGAQALAERYGPRYGDWVVLFRPPRKDWLQPLVLASRQRDHLRGAPTTLAGVRTLVRALRAGGGTAILPDQVPPLGQGVWAPFWGQPAYTMTLLPRLVQQTGASVVLTWCERRPGGRFKLHLQRWSHPLLTDPQADPQQVAQAMNEAVEQLVRQHPEQYLWGYERYKDPRQEAH
jgi:KDO2-lipid IV(A) lauroyltransferase